MYPNKTQWYADGVSAIQTRFAVMADLARWAIPDMQTVPQHGLLSRNSAFEVLAVNEYFTDYAQDQLGSWNVPIFQVAANPWIVTGTNTQLTRPDILPPPGPAEDYAERPACVTVNKPTRFFGDPGGDFDTDQPRTG